MALPAGTMFPMALARATIRHAKAADGSFDALFFYGEKVKPPQAVNVLIGRVPEAPGRPADPRGRQRAGQRPQPASTTAAASSMPSPRGRAASRRRSRCRAWCSTTASNSTARTRKARAASNTASPASNHCPSRTATNSEAFNSGHSHAAPRTPLRLAEAWRQQLGHDQFGFGEDVALPEFGDAAVESAALQRR